MPNDVIWSSVAPRVDADRSSRGASKVTVWREDACADGAHTSTASSIDRRLASQPTTARRGVPSPEGTTRACIPTRIARVPSRQFAGYPGGCR